MTSRELVDMIASGNNVEAEDAFKHAISHKVSDALEDRRRELAASFVNTKSVETCLLYTSPSPRDISGSRMPSSA